MARQGLCRRAIEISIFIIFECFVCSATLYAETIVLKTGGVIRGDIVQDINQDIYGEQIKVQSDDGQLLTIALNDIETIDGKLPQPSEWLTWKGQESVDDYWHSVLLIMEECEKIAMGVEQTAFLKKKDGASVIQESKNKFNKLIDELKTLQIPEHLDNYHAKVMTLCEYLATIFDEDFYKKRNAAVMYWRKADLLEIESFQELKRVFIEMKTPQSHIEKVDKSIKNLEHASGALNMKAMNLVIKGLTAAAAGDLEAAKKEFEKSLKLGNPSDFVQPYMDILKDVERGTFSQEYGRTFFRAEEAVVTGHPREAIKDYEELLRERDDNRHHIAERLRIVYLDAGRLEDAQALSKKYSLEGYQTSLQEYKKPIEGRKEAEIDYGGQSKIVDESEYIFYIPSGLIPGKKFPLVIAFSPNGDAASMLQLWQGIADKKKWFVCASKTFRNGQDIIPIFDKLHSALEILLTNYPIDVTAIIVTGMSGGGMGAHFFSFYYPQMVSAIIVNTGMIDSRFKATKTGYPMNKIAVFLASPIDFRYREMQSDKDFLESLGWKIKWIEFPGGHIIASEEVYDEAVNWLEEALGIAQQK